MIKGYNVNISITQLVEVLSSLKGTTMVTLVTQTVPKMKKENNPFAGNIEKITTVNGVLNFQYERSVNLQRGREELEMDFKALPRAWGQRINGTPLVEHNGKLYLEIKCETVKPTYCFLNGEKVDINQLQDFLPYKSETRQDVHKEIVLKDYKLDSIKAIRIQGKDYVVK